MRLDVVAYLTDALKTFAKVGPAKMRTIGVEVAMLGRSGLDINNPAKKYKLKNLPGEFSGLHLLAIMYAAFQQIDPSADLGADFSAEYKLAVQSMKN
jgi:hypothetical protein